MNLERPTAYLFLDTETTGTTINDQAWQVAFLLETDDQKVLQEGNYLVRHSVPPSPWTLANTKYAEHLGHNRLLLRIYTMHEVVRYLESLFRQFTNDYVDGRVQLVGFNPQFDERMILKEVAWEVPAPAPGIIPKWWGHRHISIGTLAMQDKGLRYPSSTEETCALYNIDYITHEAHDASYDVGIARKAFWKITKGINIDD